MSKENLRNSLASRGACTPEQFDEFCVGFIQASPRFLLVDVGPKDGTESKIAGKTVLCKVRSFLRCSQVTEYLATYIRFPQTLRLFLGGMVSLYYTSNQLTQPPHSNLTAGSGSISALRSLAHERLLRKLVLLSGAVHEPASLAAFRLPALRIAGLFAGVKEPLTPTSPLSPPHRAATALSYHIDSSGLASPDSPVSSMLPSVGGPREIDPTKVRAPLSMVNCY
jgi:hypothetical protein